MIDEHSVMRWLWTLLASIGGAISALSFRPYERMSRTEVGLSLFVSMSFALFFGPLVAYWLFRDGPVDTRIMGAVMWAMAAGSHYLIPIAIRRIGKGMMIEEDERE